MSDRTEIESGAAELLSGDSQKSVSNLKSIFEPPKETSSQITPPPMPDQQVTIKLDVLPIDSEVALLKEEVLISYYFGKADVSAGDFINANLINILDTQLLQDELSLVNAKKLVFEYLANYVNWACLANLHSIKAANKVRMIIIYYFKCLVCLCIFHIVILTSSGENINYGIRILKSTTQMRYSMSMKLILKIKQMKSLPLK